MSDRSNADRLVRSAVLAAVSAPSARVPGSCDAPRQELPGLDLIGAAIARASRLAAARHRAAAPLALVGGSQAAALLKPSQRELDALFADLNADDGRPLPPTPSTGGRVWRLHAAPAEAGPGIASRRHGHADLGGFSGAGA